MQRSSLALIGVPKLAAMTQAAAENVQAQTTRPDGLLRRLATIVGSHTTVDLFAAIVPPLYGVLQVRCDLTPQQAAWLLGVGSLSSGLSQPISAWLSDRFDSRLFGAAGLAMAAVCLSCIGLADDFRSLLTLYIGGMIGVGIFHPVGASTMGQLADQFRGRKRSIGISVFFVAGMAGGITGSLIARQVATAGEDGFSLLRFACIPGLIVAAILFVAIRRVPHRHHEHHLMRFQDAEIARRWYTIGLLLLGNALRFTVNMALVYLFVRWAEARVTGQHPLYTIGQVANHGAQIAGLLGALLVLGMAVGGLTAGTLVRQGREKWLLVAQPIIFAPIVALFGGASLLQGYALAVLAGIGFASMIPVTLSLAQRLLPHRTSLASGLMLGGAWTIAVVGPRLAEYCLGTLNLGLPRTFQLTAVLLAISGLVCLPLNSALLRRTAGDPAPPT